MESTIENITTVRFGFVLIGSKTFFRTVQTSFSLGKRRTRRFDVLCCWLRIAKVAARNNTILYSLQHTKESLYRIPCYKNNNSIRRGVLYYHCRFIVFVCAICLFGIHFALFIKIRAKEVNLK